MKKKIMDKKVHCLVLSYPGQGHINPMLHLSKLLQHEGVKVTLVTTIHFLKTLKSVPSFVPVETISDGFDNGGIGEAGGPEAYLDRFWQVGPKNLAQLIEKLGTLGDKVDCLIYDSLVHWALDVAKRLFGIVGVPFFTQNMYVNYIYYNVHLGNLKVPLNEDEKILLPLLPRFELEDMPSFFFTKGSRINQVLLDLLVGQFSNIHKADWILCNTFYEMEKEVVDWTLKILPKFRPIGPCIPPMFLDKLKDDEDYHSSQFKSNEKYMEWLNEKPKGSVVYVSFGTMVSLNEEQVQEIAYGLRDCEIYFLWIVRASEEIKLPKDFENETKKKGLIIPWCSQLKVLAHEAIGCFVTHCGWNSTLETLSLGVPIIAIPQWSDQKTNAKLLVDVWKMGIRAPIDEKKIVRQDKLKDCILEIMESEKGKEIKRNASQWKSLAFGAFGEGGSSQKNIEEFVTSLFNVVHGLTH